MAENSTLTLKVLEAYTRDVGKGEARIDQHSMDSIAANDGDVIELRGKRGTVAKCLPLDPSKESKGMIGAKFVPLNPSHESKGIIRVDGLIRNNAGVAIGDTVVVRKITAASAKKVVVAPLETIPPIDERYIPDALEGVPLIKGDNVMVPYFGGRLTFQVLATIPSENPVVVNVKTEFKITEAKNALGHNFRIEYGVRSEANKNFLIMKFILSNVETEQVGYFEKELEQGDVVKKMFVKYRNVAEQAVADANDQLVQNFLEENSKDVTLADTIYLILDRCRSIKD